MADGSVESSSGGGAATVSVEAAAEIALIFCRECRGWEDAYIVNDF